MIRNTFMIGIAVVLAVSTMLAAGCAAKPAAASAAQPGTVDEFVPVFAYEMARYNQAAPLCWPDNAVFGKSVVLEDVDTNRFWLIAPDGAVSELSEEDAGMMGVSRRDRPDDFSFYDGGMYITVSDQSVKDKYGWDKPHVGAYDSILWLTHEGFHKWEQDGKWSRPDQEADVNSDREEFLLDISARAKRGILQRQLMRAAAEPGNTGLILDALATYEDYKTQNAGDYENAMYFDRIEGTAQYFELVSSLYIFYPGGINSKADLERAFVDMAQYEDSYVRLGAVSESYNIGMFACVLLDRLDGNWKEEIMSDPCATPLEILSARYEGEMLPAPKQASQEEIDKLTEDVREKVRFLIERQTQVLTGLKMSLVDMPAEERAAYEMFFDDLLGRFQDMIVILPADEQQAQEDFITAMRQ